MFGESKVASGDLTTLSYVAGCIYEALESNAVREIPEGVRDCASALLTSAARWAQKSTDRTPEDNESYNKVAKVIAFNLNAAGTKNITRDVIASEIMRISYDFEIACRGSKRASYKYNKTALLRFFHSMSERLETRNYEKAAASAHSQM